MPESFDRCRQAGGKIRTRTLDGGRYQYICIYKGKVFPGEVHKKKTESNLNKVLEGEGR